MRFHRQTSDRVTIQFTPRYAEAAFAVVIATLFTAPLLVLLAGSARFADVKTLFTDFGLWGVILFLAIMGVPLTVVAFCTRWFLHCIFPRQFDLSPEEICFKGVPGAGFTTPTSNLKSILLVTHQHRSRWKCHVSLELCIGKIRRNICVNYDPICHPAEVWAHRGPDQAQWLVDAHTPLAELLACILKKPVEIRHNMSLWGYLHVNWP